MKNIIIITTILFTFSCTNKINKNTQIIATETLDTRNQKMLLGQWPKEKMITDTAYGWFVKNYENYKIDTPTALQLKPLLTGKHVEIFLGTWCGDSKREVPRMVKMLDFTGVTDYKIVFVSNHESVYKQSPGGEEKGKNIFRVPDLLVYENNKEMGRIVESPVVSLEKDLLQIVTKNNYTPQYKAANYLVNLFKKHKAAYVINNSSNIIKILKPLVSYEGELTSYASMLLREHKIKHAKATYTLLYKMFPENKVAKDFLKL